MFTEDEKLKYVGYLFEKDVMIPYLNQNGRKDFTKCYLALRKDTSPEPKYDESYSRLTKSRVAQRKKSIPFQNFNRRIENSAA